MFSAFSFWGNRTGIKMPKSVRIDAEMMETAIEAICRSIDRRNRPLCVANCREDIRQVDRDGHVLSRHYELTIGKPLRGGGYAVHGQLWCAIHSVRGADND